VSAENNMAAPDLNEDELFSYVINNNRTTKTEVTDTVILQKIRL
jgi:hypothetical protein